MAAIDFSRSYMRWESPGNNVRILIEAACTITDDKAGTSDSYYLIAPCRGESTHGRSGELVLNPGYEFSGVWGDKESFIIRWHWQSSRDNRQAHRPEGVDICMFENTRELADNQAVFDGTLGSGEPMVSRTTIRDESRGLTAVLDYPVNTMNVKENPVRYQVDTGPLIFPDFTKDTDSAIEMFEVAYVVYNLFDEAYFTLRKPLAAREGDDPSKYVTDYSEIRVLPVKNQILLAVGEGE